MNFHIRYIDMRNIRYNLDTDGTVIGDNVVPIRFWTSSISATARLYVIRTLGLYGSLGNFLNYPLTVQTVGGQPNLITQSIYDIDTQPFALPLWAYRGFTEPYRTTGINRLIDIIVYQTKTVPSAHSHWVPFHNVEDVNILFYGPGFTHDNTLEAAYIMFYAGNDPNADTVISV